MGWKDLFKNRAPRLHRFLVSARRRDVIVREVLGGALAIVAFLALLFAATGQPLVGGYPVVVVTSGSMMHCDNGNPALGRECDPTHYGRLGTIDPGDLVFVRAIDHSADVHPWVEEEVSRYGGSGDVVVFHPYGDKSLTPIIHRALFWLEVHADGTYSVPPLGLLNVTHLQDPKVRDLTGGCELDLTRFHGGTLGPEDSGFITRGDNNAAADQCSGRLSPPVRMEWVIGKARGELPWIGLIKLLFDDIRGGSSDFRFAGGDSKVMLTLTLAILFGGPTVWEKVQRRRAARKAAGPSKFEEAEKPN